MLFKLLPPESNLTHNRSMALKMLDRVLKKYCKDVDQRALVWKAWQKMIDKNHLVFYEDLSTEQKKMLDSAPVSYWIPWNLQFEDSISTPIRPVFNASSKTATIPNHPEDHSRFRRPTKFGVSVS